MSHGKQGHTQPSKCEGFPSIRVPKNGWFIMENPFFPRASERRVLLIVGVCHHILSSHLLIFTSSLIFSSSHLLTSSHIFSSSHLLTSSHIFSHLLTSSHICSHLLTSSHIFSHLLSLSPSCPLALFSLLLFYFSLKARGSANEAPRNATFSHEMRFDQQKLRVKLRF